MEYNLEDKYYLSTEGYYFKYRHDKNNNQVIRATLYNVDDKIIDDVRKTEGYGMHEKTHFDVINYFESRLMLKII